MTRSTTYAALIAAAAMLSALPRPAHAQDGPPRGTYGAHEELHRPDHGPQHDARAPHHGRPEVRRRELRQQRRIDQGVRSGRLTPREAGHLERREHRINEHIAADRADHGGKLTPGEKRRINRQEDRTSRAIYHDKHNGPGRK